MTLQSKHVMSPPTSKYRPDIDGLRAIAVLAVIAYHAFPTVLGGGFAGVDVFFVISGFLISSILFEQIQHHQFDIIGFYRRRICRSFPALLVVLVFSFGIGEIALFRNEFDEFVKELINGTRFTANFYFWKSFGYFDPAASVKPLLHLWSLAIEEQFYIVWPVFLWILYRARLGWGAALVTLLLLSCGIHVYLMHADPIADYYSPFARAWELALGSLVAYSTMRNRWTLSSRIADTIGITGIIGLFASLILVRSDQYPGLQAFLPTTATALILVAGKSAWSNRTVLSARPLVAIGLISYALYLWHWPLLTYARILEGETPAVGMRLSMLAIAFIFSWMTYLFIERPTRFGKYLPAKALLALSCMAALWLLGRNALQTEDQTRGIDARYPLISSSTFGQNYPKSNNDCALSKANRKLLTNIAGAFSKRIYSQ
jgi:peptidoglycan/LPS O-acetylase OafA/YrhL